MKRIFTNYILVPAALGLMASCASDDVVDPEGAESDVPIVFRNTALASQTVTRSVGLETKGISDFYVWGYKTPADGASGLQTIMEEYTVHWATGTAGTTDTNVADWEYVGQTTPSGKTQYIKYWDTKARDYRFFGAAPTVIESGKTVDDYLAYGDAFCSHCQMNSSYKEVLLMGNDDNMPYYSTLWYSDNSVPMTPAYGDVVTLTYKKPYARVRIKLQYESGTYGSYEITDIRFAPADGKTPIPTGTTESLAIHYPVSGNDHAEHVAWPTSPLLYEHVGAITEPYEEAPLHHATVAEKWYYVLPTQDIATFFDGTVFTTPFLMQDYTLNITVNKQHYQVTVPKAKVQWLQNHEYTYVFKVKPSGVTLGAIYETVIPWQAGVSTSALW